MKKIILVLSLVSSFSAFAANPTTRDCQSEASYPEISKKDLQTKIADRSAFVVDVNSAESFKTASVPTSIHFGANEKNFAKTLPMKKDALIVAYCGGPECTAWKKAAEEACKLGYTNIKHFKAGISGWKKSG